MLPIGKINLGLNGLEAAYELPVGKQTTWENSLGIGMGSNVYGTSVEYHFNFSQPVPFLKSKLKYIYNFNKRDEKGKNTTHNSGNYIGLQTKYNFGNSSNYQLNKTLLTEVHWGIQRSLGRGFMVDAHIGLGYIKDFDTKDGALSPTVGLRFGYNLF